MLGRAANGIFWMFRYMERAENTARLVDAGYRMALTRGAMDPREEWRSVVATAGQKAAYEAQFSDYTGRQVSGFMLSSRDHSGSVLSMIDHARSNARMVRTGLTRDVWEAVNECWMQLGALLARPAREANIVDIITAIRRQTSLVRGAVHGSMLRTDGYNFARIGSFIERADATARILDVKYHVLLPSVSYVGSSLDNVQWENVLRSVGAHSSFRWLKSGDVNAKGIADFMILDERFPRSLAYCYAKLRSNLENLARDYGHEMPCHELVRGAHQELTARPIDAIFDSGLHEFIIDFINRNNCLARQIGRDYRFTE